LRLLRAAFAGLQIPTNLFPVCHFSRLERDAAAGSGFRRRWCQV
jgi:hypothetical protein